MSQRWVRPLRVHLSAIIVVLLIAISAPLMWLTFYEGRESALESATHQMRLLSRGTVDLYEGLFLDGYNIISLGAVIPALAVEPPAWLDAKREFLVRALQGAPNLESAYVGYPDGSFVHIMRAASSARWRESVDAPVGTVFGMRVVLRSPGNRPLSVWHFLDADGLRIGSGPEREVTFDPRRRPWYRQAVQERDVISTGPYTSASTDSLTLTLAGPSLTNPDVVIGADVLLETISEMLVEHAVSPGSVGYVFDAEGRLIVHSDPAQMAALLDSLAGRTMAGSLLALNETTEAVSDAEDKLIGDVLARAGKSEPPKADAVLAAVQGLLDDTPDTVDDLAQFRVGSALWLARLASFDKAHLLAGYRIVIAAPVRDFTEANVELLRKTLTIAFVLVICGIIVALVISRRISQALVKLAEDATQIGNLDFRNWQVARSRISEINMLSRALSSAREAIHTFAIYVPRELVRRIVASGLNADAAERREVTVLFTDIRDFTTISEQHSPEQVVDMLGEYFEAMNVIVERNNGVIVQYLGDSIYAMWNAPTDNPAHVSDGCRCALELKTAIETFNAKNAAAGRPELITRFGLHTGVAVVGSVGAQDRRQYTAMGDTINVASRLEGMNKQYGTTILTTQAVKDRVREGVLFRPLGAASAKGRHEQLEIFELLEQPAHPSV